MGKQKPLQVLLSDRKSFENVSFVHSRECCSYIVRSAKVAQMAAPLQIEQVSYLSGTGMK